MSKKFNIREWVLSVKYWSLLFIPHTSICLIFIIYIVVGASIIQEIESKDFQNSSSIKPFQRERERLLSKLIEKSQILDLPQYTRYAYKHIRQYEDEIRKQSHFQENSTWNFSRSLLFIGTTLTTIGSNEFIPKTNIGKLFLIIYTGFGIPLTLVFLTDLSYLIEQLIEYISLIIFGLYSSKYFIRIRRLGFIRFIEKQLHICIADEEFNLSQMSSYVYNISANNLSIMQLITTLLIYILIGSWFIPSESYFDSVYLCFTTIFTISFNRNISEEKNLFFTSIYLLCGLAITLLCIQAVKLRIERLLTNIGEKLLRNLVEFTQQLGFHNLDANDLLTNTTVHSNPIAEPRPSQNRLFTRAKSLEHQTLLRPVGIAEPLRRLSSGIIRTLTSSDKDNNQSLDKSVQVSTIIRRCGRCAESILPILPVRKYSIISNSSSSMTDNSSGGDDDDIMDFPPPNLDRIRQRRATLVAKTIISQMATQPRSSSIDELVPPLPRLSNNRYRSSNSSPNSVACSVKVSASSSPELHRKREGNQEEFSKLSEQIAALLTPSDDEN